MCVSPGLRAPRVTRKRGLGKSPADLLFFLPYVIGLLVFVLGPVGALVFGSLSQWNLYGGSPQYIGVSNFVGALHDPVFWQAMLNTVYYTAILVPAEMVIAFGLAYLLSQRIPFVNLFRTLFFLPFVFSLASIGLVWSWFYSPTYGWLDTIFQLFHLAAPNWLQDPHMALLSIVITSVWRNAGYYMVIFIAGLKAIPSEIYEAASIDGATAWSKLTRITLPLLSPIIFLVGIMAVILGFQVFDLSYIMTSGGPDNATLTLIYLVYKDAFQNANLGYASAIGVITVVVMLVFTLLYVATQRKWVHYGA